MDTPINPGTLHPVRWAVVLLLGLPLLLLLLDAVTGGHSNFGRNLLRVLRYVLVAECALLALAAGAGAIYQAVSDSKERDLYRPPGQLVDLGGYRLHLYCSGRGSPTVVLDHGLDGSYLDWSRVQPEVANFVRVCSYDRGGYGWSDPSPKLRVPSAMAGELHELLARSGEKPPYVLVGHSFGGLNALMYAHKYREEVAAVVLVDSSHPDELLPFTWRQKTELRIMQFAMPFGLPRWRGWCGTGPAEIAPIKRAIACRSRVCATQYAQWEMFADSTAEVRNLGLLGNLPLVVVSRDPQRRSANPNDGAFSQEEQRWEQLQERLGQLSANSTHVVAQGSGHSVPMDRPDVVVAAIRKTVEGVKNSD